MSLFVVSAKRVPPLLEPEEVPFPERVRTYELEDEAGVLRGRSLYEYDLAWREMPDDIASIVEAWLVAALTHTGALAWFGFEGSFDFDHILSRDTAAQVYGVAAGEAVKLALDDGYRSSDAWADLLGGLRLQFLERAR